MAKEKLKHLVSKDAFNIDLNAGVLCSLNNLTFWSLVFALCTLSRTSENNSVSPLI